MLDPVSAWQPARVHRLLLLRHAKSSWADPGVRDHDRPLNDRGRRAAVAMGDHLRSQGWIPDLILCSSARRTCETAALLALPAEIPIEIRHDLYLADPDAVRARIQTFDDATPSVLVIGHNPTTHELALDLARRGDSEALTRLATKYPTGALAVLDLDAPWADLRRGSARLTHFVSPRELPQDSDG